MLTSDRFDVRINSLNKEVYIYNQKLIVNDSFIHKFVYNYEILN